MARRRDDIAWIGEERPWRQCPPDPLAARHDPGHAPLPRADRSGRGRRPQGARRDAAPRRDRRRRSRFRRAGRSPIGARDEDRNPATFHVKSFGCQMNVYDGERMAELLEAEGMTAAADGEAADLVVLNTCHIREKAAEKVYSDIGRLKRADGSAADDRRRRLRRPGRGRGDSAPRAERRHRRRPAGLSPPAGAGRARRRRAARRSTPTCRRSPSSARCPRAGGRGRAPSSPCRKAATNSAPIASCPTRAAPKSRGRSAAIVDEAQGAGRRAARREITLLGQNVNAWRRTRAGRAWTA